MASTKNPHLGNFRRLSFFLCLNPQSIFSLCSPLNPQSLSSSSRTSKTYLNKLAQTHSHLLFLFLQDFSTCQETTLSCPSRGYKAVGTLTMEKLPLEMIDLVSCYSGRRLLSVTESTNMVFHPQIVHHVAAIEDPCYGPFWNSLGCSSVRECLYNCGTDLANLRLVNSTFCHSASRLFFGYLFVDLVPENQQKCLAKLEEFSKSTHAIHPFHVELQLSSEGSDDLLFYNRLLPILVRFTRLRALIFQYPEDMGNWFALSLLNHLPLHRLTELELKIESDDIFNWPPSETNSVQTVSKQGLQTLRSLRLKGSTSSKRDSAAALSQLLQTAVNVESLSVVDCYAEEMVGMICPKTLPRLKTLCLENVNILYDSLFEILKQSRESIASIEFLQTSLLAGLWLHLFFQISRDLNLLEFGLGEVFEPFEEARMELKDLQKLQHVADEFVLCYFAVGDIQRKVKSNRRAAGLGASYYGDYYSTLPPLKAVMGEAEFQELSALPEL
jgi:hypothetical protein